MQSNTVIDFLARKQIKELDLRKSTISDIEDTADLIVSHAIETMNHYGYMPDNSKDVGLLFEVVKSLLMRTMDLEHFLQTVSDKYVQIID